MRFTITVPSEKASATWTNQALARYDNAPKDPGKPGTLQEVHSNPVKSAIALFLAEILGKVLMDGPPEELVWRYVAMSITELDRIETARAANFHAVFLYGLAGILGIAPDTGEYRRGMVFDMLDARFRLTPPLHSHFLSAADSRAVITLSRLDYSNMHRWKMSKSRRRELLDSILQYYTLHHAQLTSLKSLDVLRSLM